MFSYRQPEGAFTQPNGAVNQKMLSWAFEAIGERDDDLLELYCGNGNFTLPLATRVRQVLATGNQQDLGQCRAEQPRRERCG